MIELFTVHVLPHLQRSLQDLTILTSGLDGGAPRHLVVSLFDEYSGEYYPYVGYTFDDEAEFTRLSFPALRSIEYAAELFGFVWVPEGIKRLCVRHGTIPEVRWWKELVAKEMKDLERLEVWVDCEILSYSAAGASGDGVNYWSRWTEVAFRDLKSLVIASNSSDFGGQVPGLGVIEGEVRPGDDNVIGVPVDITRAIIAANSKLEDVFVESVDSLGLVTLLSRGRVRSLTVQNCWGVDTQRRYCFPFSVESIEAFRGCRGLEWLQFCVRGGKGGGVPGAVVEVLAVGCLGLRSFVVEVRGGSVVVGADGEFPVVETGEVKGDFWRWVRLGRPEEVVLAGFCERSAVQGFYVFDLEGFRKESGLDNVGISSIQV